MTECSQYVGPDYSTIRIDVGLIKSNARKEALQGSVAVPVDVFLIEASPCLIEDVVRDCTRIRDGEGVVPSVVLLQSEPYVGTLHQGIVECLCRSVIGNENT